MSRAAVNASVAVVTAATLAGAWLGVVRADAQRAGDAAEPLATQLAGAAPALPALPGPASPPQLPSQAPAPAAPPAIAPALPAVRPVLTPAPAPPPAPRAVRPVRRTRAS